MEKMFKEIRPGESLDDFMRRCVRPTDEENASLKENIDALATFLKQDFPHSPYTVAEVRKSGSLAKGTGVKNRADIDLVVYLNGIENINDLGHKRVQILDVLEQKVAAYNGWKEPISLKYKTKYNISYNFGKHQVDILPAFDVLKHIGEPAAIYNKMEPPELRHNICKSRKRSRCKQAQAYSASLAPLQVEFVRQLPAGVKDTIRLLKYWKMQFGPPKGLPIRSYSLELLAAHVYKQNGWTSIENLFRECVKTLAKPGHLSIAFDANYKVQEFIGVREPPFILDPANPFMNTVTNLKGVCTAAHQTLGL